MKALYLERFGSPEVLRFGELPDPAPGEGEVLVRTEAIGLNFADVYRRQGRYPIHGEAPYILGREGAGRVVAAPPESGLEAGQRVGFTDAFRVNAELVTLPADKVIPLPADISCETAAAVLLQGLTAHYLVRDSFAIKQGDVAVVHAAAGGVGLLLIQQIVARGGRALGLTSSAEKAGAAREAGAEQVFLYGEDWVSRVLAATEGRGARVVYDSVGGPGLPASFAAARVGGAVVFYGMSGGDPDPVDPRRLMDTSKTLTGGDLSNVVTTADERRERSAELFEEIRHGRLKAAIGARFPLAEGAEAHRLLESRRSSGKILLFP